MTRTAIIPAVALAAVAVAAGSRVTAQSRPPDANLRARVEQRFDVLPLRNGIALRPRDAARNVRSIELADGIISVDGQPATGVELRERLGPDAANLVLELSYLSEDDRRVLFGAPAPAPPAAATPVPPAPPDPLPSPERPRARRGGRDGDRVQIGRSIRINEGEVVDGDVVAVGGSVTVGGEVRGDVVSVGGSITLGPKASVANNVVVVGGQLRRDPSAQIGGRTQEIAIGALNFENWRLSSNPLRMMWGSMVGAAFALAFTLTRLAVLCLLAALVVLFAQSYMERAGARAAADPLKAGAIGLLAQLLFLPILVITVVVLIMTIVGIPLLLLIPFVILGLAVVGLVGFTGVAHRLGHLALSRFGRSVDNPYLTSIAGIILVLSPLLLARLIGLVGNGGAPFSMGLGVAGTLLEYLVWTVGFGAVALMRFSGSAPLASAPATA
jgi:hypothetical protein